MKKTERTVKQQVASAHATLYVILAIVMLLGVDTHWVFALISITCFIIAYRYDKLAHK